MKLSSEICTSIRHSKVTSELRRALKDCRLSSYIVGFEGSKRIHLFKKHRAAEQNLLPRSANTFILRGRAKQAEVMSLNRGLSNNDISRLIGAMWRNEAENVKDYFRLQAQEVKVRHHNLFPDYVYRPRKCRSTKSSTDLPHNESDAQNQEPSAYQMLPIELVQHTYRDFAFMHS